jgi:hypothetical protein
VIGGLCYTFLPRNSPAAAQTAQKMTAPGTTPVARRLLTIVTAIHGPHMHTHANNSKLKETVHEYKKTALKTSLEPFYAL